MKKHLSLILALILAFACLTALGGCGREAELKQAFIASRGDYSELLDTLAAPVADIDSEALADGAAEGLSGSLRFNVEGLSSFAALTGDLGDGVSFETSFVSDGLAASGDLSLTALGETLNALFSTDGSDVAVSLPDLLPRPMLVTADMLAELSSFYGDYPGYGVPGDDWELLYDEDGNPYTYYYVDEYGNECYYPYEDYALDGEEYDDGHGLLYLEPDAYDAEYDFDENGKYYAENGDLYVDADGDGKLDLAFAAGEYDEEYVDNIISNTREFYDDLNNGEDVGYFAGDDDGSFGFPGFDMNYVSLIARYADRFLGNVSDGCYSSGKESFRTADGTAELDCLTLDADGVELTEALRKTLTEIADDPGLEEICGGNADATREYLREAAGEELTQELKDELKKSRLTWKRFSKDGATVGERFNAKLPDAEFTLDAGLDKGENSTLAFLKLTDEKQGSKVFDAESAVGRKKATLKLSFVAGGVPYSFEITGKTTEQDGAKVTDAAVKVGFGGFTVKLFDMKTTVREFDGSGIDLEAELGVSLPKLLVGSDIDLKLSFAIEAKSDPGAAPEALDVSDAYTREEMESEAFGEELENAMKEKLPRLYELFTSARHEETADVSAAA